MTDFQHKLTAGAVSGFVSAFATDLSAFRAWKTWQDAATYDWPTAAFRWVQGAVFGVLAAFGVATL